MADDNDSALPVARKAALSSGSMFYAPGSPCNRGHVARRRTSNGKCCACEQSEEHKRAAVAKARDWESRQDPDRMRAVSNAGSKRRRLADPEAARARDRLKRAGTPSEVLAARMKSWRSRNAEHVTQYDNAYKKRRYHADPDRARLKSQRAGARRQARLYAAEGTFTTDDIMRLFDEQGGKCAGFWCDKEIADEFEVDHREPLSRGGSNWPDNLALLCQSCNRRKSDRTMPEWFQSLGGYQCPKSRPPLALT